MSLLVICEFDTILFFIKFLCWRHEENKFGRKIIINDNKFSYRVFALFGMPWNHFVYQSIKFMEHVLNLSFKSPARVKPFKQNQFKAQVACSGIDWVRLDDIVRMSLSRFIIRDMRYDSSGYWPRSLWFLPRRDFVRFFFFSRFSRPTGKLPAKWKKKTGKLSGCHGRWPLKRQSCYFLKESGALGKLIFSFFFFQILLPLT